MFSINEEQLGFGMAINFNDICYVYPLTIAEILSIGKDNYDRYLQYLTIEKDNIQKELLEMKENELTPLDCLLLQCSFDNTFLVELQKAFYTFIKERVRFSLETKEIFIGEDFSEKRIINKDNFEDFQNIIRAQNCLEVKKPIPKNENYMQKKFRLAREKREAAKKKQALKNGETISFMDSIFSLICYGIGFNFEDIKKLTIYQFNKISMRAHAKYVYDMEIRMLAAGADPKKIKPKSWFGKIEN